MIIDRALLDKMAHLARLEFDEESADRMLQDMSKIVSWVEKLKTVDTTGVEPLISMAHQTNVFREDEVREELPHERAMINAPKTDQGYFIVPKVIE